MSRCQTIMAALSLAGLLASVVVGRSNPTHTTLSLSQRFQSELAALHQQHGFPGATAAYRLADGTIGVAAVGLADVEAVMPMRPDSRMLAASIGKMFVAATVLALAQEGALDLDAPIEKVLADEPWWKRLPHRDAITLRQLLMHRSGIANHVSSEGFLEAFRQQWRQTSRPMSPRELVELALCEPPAFKPGAGWRYSDTGYLLVGLAIEKVTGRRYDHEISRLFLEQLKLLSTNPSDRLQLPGLATGYTASDNPLGLPVKTTVRPGVMAWHPGIEWTGGGLVSTPRDLVVWAGALFEGHAIKGDYLDELLSAAPIGDDSGTHYGLGVGIRKDGPVGASYGHGGWIPGYCSSLRYYPGHRLAVAFQVNTDANVLEGSPSVIDEIEARLARAIVPGKAMAETPGMNR